MSTMAHIFATVLMPVLVMVGLGALIQRVKAIDVQTLVTLNLYIFVPCFLFEKVARSNLQWNEMGMIGVCVLLPMAMIGLPLYALLKSCRASGNTIAAMAVGGLFFNAGNFGIPVARLAYGRPGEEAQALIVMFVNTTIFFLGYSVLAAARGDGALKGVLGYFKLPMIYAIVLGLIVRESGMYAEGWPEYLAWFEKVTHWASEGLIPVALITLGAQLATRPRWPKWSLIGPVLVLKLLAMPAATALIVYAFGLWPWPGAQLVLAAAGPTAVNTLLLTIELDGDRETAADCVFWTTLLSAVSVTAVLMILLATGGRPPA